MILPVIITALPILVWLLTPPHPAFSLYSLGQAFGLLGASLFCFNFLLSTRLKFLEKLFVGLNRLYYWHHQLGAAALVFLLFHPTLMAFQFLSVSSRSAFEFLFPPLVANIPVWFGITALTLVILLLFITFYIRLRYPVWRFTHQFLGIGLLFALLHMFTISGNLSANIPLKVLMLSYASTALAAFLYRTVFFRLLVPRRTYRVSSVQPLSSDISQINLTPLSPPFSYSPGQFAFFSFHTWQLSLEPHPFSFVSVPSEKTLSFAFKSVGDYTSSLKHVSVGDMVQVEGPFGVFSHLITPNKKQLWIAGGIGITPFVSLAKSLPPNHDYDITLVYSVSHASEAVLDQFFHSVKYHLHDSSQKGRLTADLLVRLLPDLHAYDIFICGPAPMLTSLRSQFRSLGFPSSKIHSEEFSLY